LFGRDDQKFGYAKSGILPKDRPSKIKVTLTKNNSFDDLRSFGTFLISTSIKDKDIYRYLKDVYNMPGVPRKGVQHALYGVLNQSNAAHNLEVNKRFYEDLSINSKSIIIEYDPSKGKVVLESSLFVYQNYDVIVEEDYRVLVWM